MLIRIIADYWWVPLLALIIWITFGLKKRILARKKS